MLKYDWIKDTVNTVLKDYIYPRNLHYESSISTSQYSTIEQVFYPFSSTISDCLIYVKDTVGNYACTINILYGDKTLATQSTFNIGWNTISVNKGDLVTKKECKIQIVASKDTVNYVVFGASTIDKYYWSATLDNNSSSLRLAFSIGINEIIYDVFPKVGITLDKYPIVVSDLSSRPRVNFPYISSKVLEEVVTLTYSIYSQYTDEIDLLGKLIERCMFKENRNISGIYVISPGPIGAISRMREDLLMRQISFNIRMYIRDTE